MGAKVPRVVIAGLSGDSGKTIVSLSLLSVWRREGMRPAAFKKGPDYIDAAWLTWAAGSQCRNLDTYLVDPIRVRQSFASHSSAASVAVVEGNRGLYDGKDAVGTHSTAELAKLLKAPVILVVSARKATRTLAAVIMGCRSFDPEVTIAGVILNRIAGSRHGRVVRDAIERYCGVQVLGMVPTLGDDSVLIPGRHLGLVPPAEFDPDGYLRDRLAGAAHEFLDVGEIMKVAGDAPLWEVSDATDAPAAVPGRVKVGYFKDSAFTFYYPENLEALQARGAELAPIDSLNDTKLPEIDALYIGGGFPETHAARLCHNQGLMKSVRQQADAGLPTYAECGGLIYLSRSLAHKGRTYAMASVLPIDLELQPKPFGHGYTELAVDRPNPFFPVGFVFKGHEFHYSAPVKGVTPPATCLQVSFGAGIGAGRDGLVHKNVLATYSHIHALGVDAWASALVERALEFNGLRKRPEGVASVGCDGAESKGRNNIVIQHRASLVGSGAR